MKHLLYLHGLFSTGDSSKGQQFATWVSEHLQDVVVDTPTLSVNPNLASKQIMEILVSKEYHGVLGSSMGGYQASWVGQELRIPTVLLNPVVNIAQLLEPFLGQIIHPVTQETVELTSEDIQELDTRELKQEHDIEQPELILCLLQTGDDTLDWKQAAQRYSACHLSVVEGGSHAYEHFESDFSKISKHLQIA